MKDSLHIDKGGHQVGLADVARDPIEDQVIYIGQEAMGVHTEFNADAPKLDGNFIRHKLTLARVFQECLAQRGARINRTEDITARAVEQTGNGSQRAALRSFAAPVCPEDLVVGVFGSHGVLPLD